MSQSITESKYMDTPSDHIVVFVLIHVLPSKFVFISQNKIMHMEFCSSCEHICFSTEFWSPMFCNHFNFDCVNVVLLQVSKVNSDFLKAVIRSSIENNWLLQWFVANVSDIDCPKFEKFSFWSLGTFQEILLSFIIFGEVKDSVKSGLVGLLIWEVLLGIDNNLFGIAIVPEP